jgi:hypothetical protein
MTPKQVAAYAKLCQKHGLRHLKIDGLELEVELGYSVQPPKHAITEYLEQEEKNSAVVAPTDEDILYWSSGPVNG